MKVSGDAVLHAPRTEVWQALTDPAVLRRAIPGCETLEPLPPAAAHLTLTAAVAATSGIYTGRAEITDRLPPQSLAIQITLTGEPAAITATLRLHLAQASDTDGSTQVSYEAHADVAGDLAAIGQSLLTAAATRFATRFFESVDELLAQAEASRTPEAGVSVAAADHAKASASGERTQHWRQRLPAGRTDMGAAAPAADRSGHGRAQGFAPGVVVGTAIGIAAAKLGTLIARRKS